MCPAACPARQPTGRQTSTLQMTKPACACCIAAHSITQPHPAGGQQEQQQQPGKKARGNHKAATTAAAAAAGAASRGNISQTALEGKRTCKRQHGSTKLVSKVVCSGMNHHMRVRHHKCLRHHSTIDHAVGTNPSTAATAQSRSGLPKCRALV